MSELYKRSFIGIVALAILTFSLPALSAPLTNDDAGEMLTNASIIELQGLTLGDAVIIEKIKTSKCSFDTSINGLKQLKAANLPGAVIEAMIATKAAVSDNAISTVAGDPNSSHLAFMARLKRLFLKRSIPSIDKILSDRRNTDSVASSGRTFYSSAMIWRNIS